MTTTPSLEATCIPRGLGTDLGLSAAATTRVPATSREDSGSQAILKYQPRNGSDYRFCYYPQLQKNGYVYCFIKQQSFRNPNSLLHNFNNLRKLVKGSKK